VKKSLRMWSVVLASTIVAVTILAGCGGGTTPTGTVTRTTTTTTTTAVEAQKLNGAGATFPAPLYTKWFDEYKKLTGVTINYQAVGSGSGINQITSGTVDFGASDGIMTDAQVQAAQTAFGPILHIPMTSGAVAVVYNLPGMTKPVSLTADVLADIYLKKIKRWDDPRIVAINQGVTMPGLDIAVVHRSDGSGTTFIFTNYLTKVSQEWSSSVGNATSVNWPGDIGGQGNAGVAAQVQQISGAIGYVELAYAIQNNLHFAALQNSSGNWIAPSLASTTKASDGVTLPDDMKIMVTNSNNPDAYPIVGFTWLLVYVNQKDKAKGEALVNMLWWAIHEGQLYSEPLVYAKLSGAVVSKAENEIRSVKFNGQSLINK